MKLIRCTKVLISVLCLTVAFCGCVTAEGRSDRTAGSSLFLKKSSYADNLYVSQSASMQTPEKELSACLFGVARQIAIRKQVFVRYTVTVKKAANGDTLRGAQVLLDYDQANSMALLEKMTVVDILQSETGTEALVKYTGIAGFKYPSVSIKTALDRDGNPAWVAQPPKGAKFYAAVGSVSQTTNRSEAFDNADSYAIGALAPNVVKPVVSGTTSMYETVLKGAYIARRWYNSSENRYYSLAILPK